MLFRISFLLICFTVNTAIGADFYVDPVNGKPGNKGSYNSPWPSLDYVFEMGLIQSQQWNLLPYKEARKLVVKNPLGPVKAGDRIILRTGDYGLLKIDSYHNSDFVEIKAQKNHRPKFESILIQGASKWKLSGLEFQQFYQKGVSKRRAMLSILSHSWLGPTYDVVIDNSKFRTVNDIVNWKKKEWIENSSDAINVSANNVTLKGNHIENIQYGIVINGSNAKVEKNVIKNFSGDGVRALGDYGVYQFNTIKNNYAVNDHHDDAIQSWSYADGRVGKGVVKGVVIRSNTIINYEDENQKFRGPLQGIGAFDGFYEDWVIENNVIMVDNWHGIALAGFRNCKIQNNTVVDIKYGKPGPAWISLSNHKDGRQSDGCVVRNNITNTLRVTATKNIIKDHNIVEIAPNKMFRDFLGYDLRLKLNAAAVDAGAPDGAPSFDIEGNVRGANGFYDIGAYEFVETK